MKRVLWSVLTLGLACTACCLPLLAPLLAAAGLGSVLATKLFGVSVDHLICRVGPWLLVLVAIVASVRAFSRRSKPSCGCDTTCDVTGCAP